MATNFPEFSATSTAILEYHAKCVWLGVSVDNDHKLAAWTSPWDQILTKGSGEAAIWLVYLEQSSSLDRKTVKDTRSLVFQEAIKHVSDDLPRIYDAWMQFERENSEDVEDYLAACKQYEKSVAASQQQATRKRHRQIEERREREPESLGVGLDADVEGDSSTSSNLQTYHKRVRGATNHDNDLDTSNAITAAVGDENRSEEKNRVMRFVSQMSEDEVGAFLKTSEAFKRFAA